MVKGTLGKDALELWEPHEHSSNDSKIGSRQFYQQNPIRGSTLRNNGMCNAQMIRNQLCCARQEKKEYMEKVSFGTFFGSWLVFQGPLHITNY